ncbi:serine hydrolase [Rhizohabitans arisaemae]|uniref:serine hydrolase n=1 Tax=Rhizohabitans arisaemae TaxID=2720610 RepID=UPI0024B121CF|nr:serine hydrolase [Rhizohabitans arisaemae]
MIDLAQVAENCPGTLAVAVHGRRGVNDDLELPLASVGKLLLLAETAMEIDAGILDPEEEVVLRDEDYCGGSGLLTALSARRWSIGDLALLTAAVSDNTATNALLRHVGLNQVNAGAAALGLSRTRLLDRIRDHRGPGDAVTFALGTAGELARLAVIVGGEDPWARMLLGWMGANTDHGLVPALLPHDQEAKVRPSPVPPGTVWVANKTGTDTGTRADVGVMAGPAGQVGYAVLAHGEPGSEYGLVAAVRQAGLAIAENVGHTF